MTPYIRPNIRRKRLGTRRGQATPSEVKAVREAVYARAGGRCELDVASDCIRGVLPFDGPTELDHGHLVHLKAKRRHGTNAEICVWGCWKCHKWLHAGGKPCPKKEVASAAMVAN